MPARKRVYIAGPITYGRLEDNIANATATGRALIELGFAPLTPQLTCYMDGPTPSAGAGFPHDTWMEVDLPWVAVADAILRLPGPSRGADIEELCARANGIPVFYSLAALQAYFAMRDGAGGCERCESRRKRKVDHPDVVGGD